MDLRVLDPWIEGVGSMDLRVLDPWIWVWICPYPGMDMPVYPQPYPPLTPQKPPPHKCPIEE